MSFPTVSLNQQQPLSCHHFSEEKIQYSKIIVYWGPSHLFIFIHFPPCTPENAGPLCHTIAVKFHLSVKFPPGWHLRQTEIWAIWLLKNYGSKLYKLLWLVKISLSLSICNTWMDRLWSSDEFNFSCHPWENFVQGETETCPLGYALPLWCSCRWAKTQKGMWLFTRL